MRTPEHVTATIDALTGSASECAIATRQVPGQGSVAILVISGGSAEVSTAVGLAKKEVGRFLSMLDGPRPCSGCQGNDPGPAE